jgi:hypothetical protein
LTHPLLEGSQSGTRKKRRLQGLDLDHRGRSRFFKAFPAVGRLLAVIPERAGRRAKCTKSDHWKSRNETSVSFESLNVWRETTQLKGLIADIDRIVQILNSDIASEEGQAGIFDCSRPEYPVLARALAARRNNLKHTMAALEQRLGLTRALDSGPHPSGTARPF